MKGQCLCSALLIGVAMGADWASVTQLAPGQALGKFGSSVAASRYVQLITHPESSNEEISVFHFQDPSWEYDSSIVPGGNATQRSLRGMGLATAITKAGDVLAIASPDEDVGGRQRAGAVYLYLADPDELQVGVDLDFAAVGRVVASTPEAGARFGARLRIIEVAPEVRVVVVGTPEASRGTPRAVGSVELLLLEPEVAAPRPPSMKLPSYVVRASNQVLMGWDGLGVQEDLQLAFGLDVVDFTPASGSRVLGIAASAPFAGSLQGRLLLRTIDVSSLWPSNGTTLLGDWTVVAPPAGVSNVYKFGTALAVTGNTVFVSGQSLSADGTTVLFGVVWVFQLSASGSTLSAAHSQTITPSTGLPGVLSASGVRSFGRVLSASQDYVAVSIPTDEPDNVLNRGSVALMERQPAGTSWSLAVMLKAVPQSSTSEVLGDLRGSLFGSVVSLTPDYLSVGAPDAFGLTGRAYVFDSPAYFPINSPDFAPWGGAVWAPNLPSTASGSEQLNDGFTNIVVRTRYLAERVRATLDPRLPTLQDPFLTGLQVSSSVALSPGAGGGIFTLPRPVSGFGLFQVNAIATRDPSSASRVASAVYNVSVPTAGLYWHYDTQRQVPCGNVTMYCPGRFLHDDQLLVSDAHYTAPLSAPIDRRESQILCEPPFYCEYGERFPCGDPVCYPRIGQAIAREALAGETGPEGQDWFSMRQPGPSPGDVVLLLFDQPTNRLSYPQNRTLDWVETLLNLTCSIVRRDETRGATADLASQIQAVWLNGSALEVTLLSGTWREGNMTEVRSVGNGSVVQQRGAPLADLMPHQLGLGLRASALLARENQTTRAGYQEPAVLLSGTWGAFDPPTIVAAEAIPWEGDAVDDWPDFAPSPKDKLRLVFSQPPDINHAVRTGGDLGALLESSISFSTTNVTGAWRRVDCARYLKLTPFCYEYLEVTFNQVVPESAERMSLLSFSGNETIDEVSRDPSAVEQALSSLGPNRAFLQLRSNTLRAVDRERPPRASHSPVLLTGSWGVVPRGVRLSRHNMTCARLDWAAPNQHYGPWNPLEFECQHAVVRQPDWLGGAASASLNRTDGGTAFRRARERQETTEADFLAVMQDPWPGLQWSASQVVDLQQSWTPGWSGLSFPREYRVVWCGYAPRDIVFARCRLVSQRLDQVGRVQANNGTVFARAQASLSGDDASLPRALPTLGNWARAKPAVGLSMAPPTISRVWPAADVIDSAGRTFLWPYHTLRASLVWSVGAGRGLRGEPVSSTTAGASSTCRLVNGTLLECDLGDRTQIGRVPIKLRAFDTPLASAHCLSPLLEPGSAHTFWSTAKDHAATASLMDWDDQPSSADPRHPFDRVCPPVMLEFQAPRLRAAASRCILDRALHSLNLTLAQVATHFAHPGLAGMAGFFDCRLFPECCQREGERSVWFLGENLGPAGSREWHVTDDDILSSEACIVRAQHSLLECNFSVPVFAPERSPWRACNATSCFPHSDLAHFSASDAPVITNVTLLPSAALDWAGIAATSNATELLEAVASRNHQVVVSGASAVDRFHALPGRDVWVLRGRNLYVPRWGATYDLQAAFRFNALWLPDDESLAQSIEQQQRLSRRAKMVSTACIPWKADPWWVVLCFVNGSVPTENRWNGVSLTLRHGARQSALYWGGSLQPRELGLDVPGPVASLTEQVFAHPEQVPALVPVRQRPAMMEAWLPRDFEFLPYVGHELSFSGLHNLSFVSSERQEVVVSNCPPLNDSLLATAMNRLNSVRQSAGQASIVVNAVDAIQAAVRPLSGRGYARAVSAGAGFVDHRGGNVLFLMSPFQASSYHVSLSEWEGLLQGAKQPLDFDCCTGPCTPSEQDQCQLWGSANGGSSLVPDAVLDGDRVSVAGWNATHSVAQSCHIWTEPMLDVPTSPFWVAFRLSQVNTHAVTCRGSSEQPSLVVYLDGVKLPCSHVRIAGQGLIEVLLPGIVGRRRLHVVVDGAISLGVVLVNTAPQLHAATEFLWLSQLLQGGDTAAQRAAQANSSSLLPWAGPTGWDDPSKCARVVLVGAAMGHQLHADSELTQVFSQHSRRWCEYVHHASHNWLVCCTKQQLNTFQVVVGGRSSAVLSIDGETDLVRSPVATHASTDSSVIPTIASNVTWLRVADDGSMRVTLAGHGLTLPNDAAGTNPENYSLVLDNAMQSSAQLSVAQPWSTPPCFRAPVAPATWAVGPLQPNPTDSLVRHVGHMLSLYQNGSHSEFSTGYGRNLDREWTEHAVLPPTFINRTCTFSQSFDLMQHIAPPNCNLSSGSDLSTCPRFVAPGWSGGTALAGSRGYGVIPEAALPSSFYRQFVLQLVIRSPAQRGVIVSNAVIAAAAAPAIDDVVPSRLPVTGGTVVVTGSGFGADPGTVYTVHRRDFASSLLYQRRSTASLSHALGRIEQPFSRSFSSWQGAARIGNTLLDVSPRALSSIFNSSTYANGMFIQPCRTLTWTHRTIACVVGHSLDNESTLVVTTARGERTSWNVTFQPVLACHYNTTCVSTISSVPLPTWAEQTGVGLAGGIVVGVIIISLGLAAMWIANHRSSVKPPLEKKPPTPPASPAKDVAVHSLEINLGQHGVPRKTNSMLRVMNHDVATLESRIAELTRGGGSPAKRKKKQPKGAPAATIAEEPEQLHEAASEREMMMRDPRNKDDDLDIFLRRHKLSVASSPLSHAEGPRPW
jgi:hypothetical protein